jgi:hypothetical protein
MDLYSHSFTRLRGVVFTLRTGTNFHLIIIIQFNSSIQFFIIIIIIIIIIITVSTKDIK